VSAVGLYKAVYSLELRRLMAYRTDFWVKFLGVLLANLAAAYFLWTAVFAARGEATLGGFTLSGMVLYYMLVPLIEGISRSHNQGFLSWEVYDGSLTRYLVYPVSYFPYQYTVAIASSTIAVIQLLLVLGIYVIFRDFPPDLAVTPASLALGLVTALAASILNFVMISVVEMAAFWADNVWSLSVMLLFAVRLLGGAMIPLTLFPDGAQQLLMLTPFPYLVAFPIQALTGQLTAGAWGQGMTVMLAWTCGIAMTVGFIWRRGNLRYTGVGQ
jgi:ABC-2 type transport system permease protein